MGAEDAEGEREAGEPASNAAEALRRKDEMKDILEEIHSRYKLVCRLCGSENIVFDCEEGIDYGGRTGFQPGWVSLGCNDCKKNDMLEYE